MHDNVNPFERLSLSDEDKVRYHAAARRKRDLSSLTGEVAFLQLCLEGQSPLIDALALEGMRCAIDEARAIAATIPARSLSDLHLKCQLFENANELVRAHRLLIKIGDASIREDAARLQVDTSTPWIAAWFEK